MSPPDPHRARRLELVLQQLQALPTLPAVAMRLLQVTSDDSADAKQVIELVRNDPALTAKVLAMCRLAGGVDRGAGRAITTVDRAVVMLGFEAIRNAVLSIKVFEMFAAPGNGNAKADADPGNMRGFDRAGFWRHSLAVAILCELITAAHGKWLRPYTPSEAFVCGLLHDLGKLAIEHLLPKSYQRVVELTEQHQLNIADVERKVIGLDHHTVGKRLAEHWQLPHLLQDCMWLHGSPPHAVPDLPHRMMIGVVTVADLAVRQQHLGYSGNYHLAESVEARSREAGLEPTRVRQAMEELHDELERRAAAMGLGQTPSRQVFLESIMQANTVLGRLNQQLEQGRRVAAGRKQTLEAIVEFHRHSSRPARGVQDVFQAVVDSAVSALGRGYYGLLYQPAANQPWMLNQYNDSARLLTSELVEPPAGAPDLAHVAPGPSLSMQMMSLLPWVAQSVSGDVDVRALSLLALPCGWGTAAVLLHAHSALPPADQLQALVHTWGAAIAATTQHLGARRLGEQLVETSRQLAEAQDKLLRNQSMARLGEMAAGAAHEMNNPLAVISGRAQLLTSRLPAESREQSDAEQIWHQSEKLSDLITALRMFADPPRPKLSPATATDVVTRAVELLMQREPAATPPEVSGVDHAPPLYTDAEQLAAVLAELLINAAQAKPASGVQVAASVDPVNGRFIFRVIDNGVGMERATLEHAFDPFFSAKPAGRQVGLGLARAKRTVEGLGGDIELASEPGRGTTATLFIPLSIDSPDAREWDAMITAEEGN